MNIQFLDPKIFIQPSDLCQIVVVEPENLQVPKGMEFIQYFDPTAS